MKSQQRRDEQTLQIAGWLGIFVVVILLGVLDTFLD